MLKTFVAVLVDGEKDASDARISVRLNFRGDNSRNFPTPRLYVALPSPAQHTIGTLLIALSLASLVQTGLRADHQSVNIGPAATRPLMRSVLLFRFHPPSAYSGADYQSAVLGRNFVTGRTASRAQSNRRPRRSAITRAQGSLVASKGLSLLGYFSH